MVSPVSPIFYVGYGMMYVAEIFNIVGMATPHWIEIEWLHLGLFQYCTPLGCRKNPDNTPAINLVRAFDVLGSVSGVVNIVFATVILVRKYRLRSLPRIIEEFSLVAAIATFLFNCVAIGVFAGKVYPKWHENQIKSDLRLGYSFVMPIIGAFLSVLGGVLVVFLGGRHPENGEGNPLITNS